jgi:hypothetical protein
MRRGEGGGGEGGERERESYTVHLKYPLSYVSYTIQDYGGSLSVHPIAASPMLLPQDTLILLQFTIV